MKTPKLEQRGTPIQIDPQKGETIEMKVRRITQNKEPITDVAQPIYMERGVKMASCDIRTDRWEVAREGVKLLATNNGTAIKETTHDEVESLKTMLPEAWDRLQIAAMVAIDNMVKQEARK